MVNKASRVYSETKVHCS